ncbi:uncharacterized protein IWZ02DRAFT_406666 [Phyllosticta citriasiana]|uniref:Ribosomal protein S17 n=1 Tax=Phyllosticta citriasiana TaxID=595635 RepID=A0ABR1KEE2_9PEZI
MPIPGAAFRQFTGVVVSAGKLPKCVKVRIAAQKWDKHIKKYFPAPYHVLCSDPTQSVQEGDVIQLRNGFRTSRTIRHVVTSIISPFGTPITERPPIPTEEERQAQLRYERLKRDIKQAANGRVAPNQRLRDAARLDGNLMHALKVAEKKGEEPPQEVQEAVARLEAEETRIAELWEKEQPFEDVGAGYCDGRHLLFGPSGPEARRRIKARMKWGNTEDKVAEGEKKKA